MAVRSESWSRPAEPGRQALLLALALSLFLGVWAALHAGFYTRSQIVDTPVYQRYGDAIAHGQVPYRDFGVEYPPGALPVFALPALGHAEESDFGSFRQVFEALMWACGALALGAMALALRALGAGRGLGQRRASDDPAAPDREPRLRRAARAAPCVRTDGALEVESRVAEPRRLRPRRDRGAADGAPGRRVARDLVALRARPGRA